MNCDTCTALKSRIEELEINLRLIGDMATGDWDGPTVGKVDAVVPFIGDVRHPNIRTYADKVRNLYKRAEDANAAEAKLAILREKAQAMLDMYVKFIDSGDAGNWDPYTEKEVSELKSVLDGKL